MSKRKARVPGVVRNSRYGGLVFEGLSQISEAPLAVVVVSMDSGKLDFEFVMHPKLEMLLGRDELNVVQANARALVKTIAGVFLRDMNAQEGTSFHLDDGEWKTDSLFARRVAGEG